LSFSKKRELEDSSEVSEVLASSEEAKLCGSRRIFKCTFLFLGQNDKSANEHLLISTKQTGIRVKQTS